MNREWCIRGAVLTIGLLGMTGGTVVAQSAQTRNAAKEPARTDPAVESWVQTLAKNIADRHDAIRDSARLGLLAVGTPALPTLKNLAKGDDAATAEAARRLIAHIEHHHHGAGTAWHGDHGHYAEHYRWHGHYAEHVHARQGWHHHVADVGHHHHFHHSSLAVALKSLHLSDKQQAKVDDIRKAYHEKGIAQFHKLMEAHKKLHQEMMNELKGALTSDQFQQLERGLHHRHATVWFGSRKPAAVH